jgi:hypothetical protein
MRRSPKNMLNLINFLSLSPLSPPPCVAEDGTLPTFESHRCVVMGTLRDNVDVDDDVVRLHHQDVLLGQDPRWCEHRPNEVRVSCDDSGVHLGVICNRI